MNELTPNDVREFHADLLTVHAAGVPLNIGLNSRMSQAALQAELQTMETTLTTLCAGGARVSDLLEHNPQFPPQYGSTLRHWGAVHGTPLAFEPAAAASASDRRSRGTLAINFVSPLSWLLLAYVAMVIICGAVVPIFEAQYRQLWATPGPVLLTLRGLRAWMPVWLIAIPVAVAVGGIVFYRARQRRASRQPPGLSQAEALRRAHLAEQASQMLAQGLPGEEVMAVLRKLTRVYSPAPLLQASGQTAPRTEELPPLLQWAASRIPPQAVAATSASASTSQPPIHPSDAFLHAASIYRGVAQQLEQSRVSHRPLRVTLLLAGGLLVLGVAVSVFGPLVEMLLFLADPLHESRG